MSSSSASAVMTRVDDILMFFCMSSFFRKPCTRDHNAAGLMIMKGQAVVDLMSQSRGAGGVCFPARANEPWLPHYSAALGPGAKCKHGSRMILRPMAIRS